MASTTKVDGNTLTPQTKTTDKTRNENAISADMRIIVTRNQRNVWQDDDYDTPPSYANLPVFN